MYWHSAAVLFLPLFRLAPSCCLPIRRTVWTDTDFPVFCLTCSAIFVYFTCWARRLERRMGCWMLCRTSVAVRILGLPAPCLCCREATVRSHRLYQFCTVLSPPCTPWRRARLEKEWAREYGWYSIRISCFCSGVKCFIIGGEIEKWSDSKSQDEKWAILNWLFQAYDELAGEAGEHEA